MLFAWKMRIKVAPDLTGGLFTLCGLILLTVGAHGQPGRRPSVSGPAGFRAGAICDGVLPGTHAANMLAGKEIVATGYAALDTEEDALNPFLVEKSCCPNGTTLERFSGMDITLLSDICNILNCTFRVNVYPYPKPKESWTSVLYRNTAVSDVVINYWYSTTPRREHVNFLYPHISASRMLVSMKPTYITKDWTEKCWTFLDPFTGGLWIMVLVVTVLYSWAIWFVEKDSE